MGVKMIQRNMSCIMDGNIRHNPKEVAGAIIEIICEDLKYRDKENDPEYIMLNTRLKEEKKRKKNTKPIFKTKAKEKPEKDKKQEPRKTSKFNEKYKERINSIKTSDEQRIKNMKNMKNK